MCLLYKADDLNSNNITQTFNIKLCVIWLYHTGNKQCHVINQYLWVQIINAWFTFCVNNGIYIKCLHCCTRFILSLNAIQLKWFLQDYCICLPSSYKVKSFFLCCRNIIQVIDLIWQDIQSRFYILVRQHQSWRWTGKHCINYHTRTVHRTVLQRTIEILVLICQHAVFFNKKTSTMNGKTAGINGIAE